MSIVNIRYELTDDQTILNFLLQPVVKDSAFTDEDIVTADAGLFQLENESEYVGLYKELTLIGVIKYEYLTTITVRVHPYILPNHMRSWLDSMDECDEWFIKNTMAHKYVVQTPQCCKSIIKMLHIQGFQLEGALIAALFWRGKIENLVLMSRFIDRVKENSDGRQL